MKNKICAIILALFVSLSIFPISASAACSHNLGVVQFETNHPHKGYRQCSKCKAKVYNGAKKILQHGNGKPGTCKQCGTHTFVGRSCTRSGSCVCGATIASYGGHKYSDNIYYEADHPHKNYKSCERCLSTAYTGTTTTLKHGDGSSGTCKKCGEHFFGASSTAETNHPHKIKHTCKCGAVDISYALLLSCQTCTANSKTTSNTTATVGVLTYIDGDKEMGTVITVPITFYVEYSNTYNYPKQNDPMNVYNYPVFASFSAKVTSHAEGAPTYAPQIQYVSNPSVSYYAGDIIATENLSWLSNFDAVRVGLFSLQTAPKYATASATCNLSGSASYVNGTTKAYF